MLYVYLHYPKCFQQFLNPGKLAILTVSMTSFLCYPRIPVP